MDQSTIAARMRSLSALGSRISLIERSHLGEFSWPFADTMRKTAETLLVERQIDGEFKPIVHVIAEGMDYQIVDDETPPTGKRRILIVAFPRQLKHHVLLHAIFGHELAHPAINAQKPGLIVRTSVMPILTERILRDETQVLEWLKRDDAPLSVRNDPALRTHTFPASAVKNWRIEIVCDLFGLLLFGPGFAAAHRTIIEALSTDPLAFDLRTSTHPPYPIRQRIISTAIRLLGWSAPITNPGDGLAHTAEKKMLEYVTGGPEGDWFALLTDDQVGRILQHLTRIFEASPSLAFVRPDRDILLELISRLTLGRPPIAQSLDENGVAANKSVPTSHCLYAGWSFWFGRDQLQDEMRRHVPTLKTLSFLEINRLCDHAMLQQCAIDIAARGNL